MCGFAVSDLEFLHGMIDRLVVQAHIYVHFLVCLSNINKIRTVQQTCSKERVFA